MWYCCHRTEGTDARQEKKQVYITSTFLNFANTINEKTSIFICISPTTAGLVVEVEFEHKSVDPEIHIFFYQYPTLYLSHQLHLES